MENNNENVFCYNSPIGIIEFSILKDELISLKFTKEINNNSKETDFSKNIKKTA